MVMKNAQARAFAEPDGGGESGLVGILKGRNAACADCGSSNGTPSHFLPPLHTQVLEDRCELALAEPGRPPLHRLRRHSPGAGGYAQAILPKPNS